MKKFIILAVAAIFVFGMIAEVAVAEERLNLSGSMRVRAWNIALGDADDLSYWDQRLRVGATVNIADGVKAVTRLDFAEDTWGSDNWGGSRYSEASELQVDRAYLQVDKGMLGITAGQAYFGLGNMIAYDNNATGIKLQIKTPVVITLGYTKEDERGSLTDESEDDTDDLDSYLINVGYAADNFTVNGFYAALMDGNDDGIEPNVFGVQGTFTLGMLSFNAELDIFGGEIYTVDVMGTQFYGNVEAALMENLKLGVDLVYSDGNDSWDDADPEIKITGLNNWNGETFLDRGPFRTDIANGGLSDLFDATPFGVDLATEGIAAFVDGSGVEFGAQGGGIGGGVYAVFTVMEGVDLYANIHYVTADEDLLWDDVMSLGIGAEWAFAPNTTLAAYYNNTSWSSDFDLIDDDADYMAARLQVNF